jgi:hypothetical protein
MQNTERFSDRWTKTQQIIVLKENIHKYCVLRLQAEVKNSAHEGDKALVINGWLNYVL